MSWEIDELMSWRAGELASWRAEEGRPLSNSHPLSLIPQPTFIALLSPNTLRNICLEGNSVRQRKE